MRIQENRIYKAKNSGNYVKVISYNGKCVHGVIVDSDCKEISSITSTPENFIKAVLSTPVTLSNYAIVDDKAIVEKDSKVIYTHAVICKTDGENHISVRCLSLDTAYSSMSRIVSETKSLKLEKNFSYSITTLKHKIV